MMLADLHMHSTFSDGKLSIPELVDLYGKRGFGAIAVTDHLCEERSIIGKAARYLERTLTQATFPLYLEILKSEAERAWDEYRMVVIPGVEITKNSISNHRSFHVLGLGITGYIDPNGDAFALSRKIRAQGALVVAAHPVSTRKLEKQTYHLWDRRQELASAFDAWEVASGPFVFDEVLESGLPMLATSDLHSPRQIHSWKTVFHCERDRDAILEAVRQQEIDFAFYGEGNPDGLRNHIPGRHARALVDRALLDDLRRLVGA